jgi:hypothetical protein
MRRPLLIIGAIALAGAGASACAGQTDRTMDRLTAAARQCGFEHPRFRLRNGIYELNETQVSGLPYGQLSPEQQRNWDRSRLVNAQWWPCLERAAKGLGVRVAFEQSVIVN